MTHATKNHSDDLIQYNSLYELQTADNARTFGIWFDDKLREVYATDELSVVFVIINELRRRHVNGTD